MSDTHNKALTTIETRSVERMHPMVQAAMSMGGGQLDTQTMRELMEMQREWQKDEAERAFNVAKVEMQGDLPTVIRHDTEVRFKPGGPVAFTHASYPAIVSKVTPIMKAHGFSFNHTDADDPTGAGRIGVTCILRHTQGHKETYTRYAPPDGSGSKNAVQATGSTDSYLKRYTLLGLLGIATEKEGVETHAGQATDPGATLPEDKKIRLLSWLKRHQKSTGDAERYVGRPTKDWTYADSDKLVAWAKNETKDAGQLAAEAIDLPPFDEGAPVYPR